MLILRYKNQNKEFKMVKHNLLKQSNTGIQAHKANENIMRLKLNVNKPIQTKFFRKNEFIIVDKNKVQNIDRFMAKHNRK